LLLGQAPQYERRLGLTARQHFEGSVRDDSERTPGTGKSLRKVVARHVLDDATARFEHLAAARNRVDAADMVTRGASLDASRARQIRSQNAPQRASARFLSEQRAVVQRLELEFLVVLGKQRLDFGQRRSRTGGQNKLCRLVKRHARKPRQVDLMGGLHIMADPALRAMPEYFNRRFLRSSPANGLEYFTRRGRG